MHYLVRFGSGQLPGAGELANEEGLYVSPDGERGWAILEREDEDSLQGTLDAGVEEVQPVLPAREYAVVEEAREELEGHKARFVDDPGGALAEARRSVGRALEARGYPSPERADAAPRERGEVLREYQGTDVGDSGGVEEMREAFGRLSDLLERSARA